MRWTGLSWAKIARRIRVPLGFVMAAAYLWLAKPERWSMLAGAAFILIGLSLRSAASGHVRKDREVTTTGPYAYTRNPLYLGSLILATGFAVAARSWWIAGGLAIFFLLIYLPAIRDEENWLRANFPEYAGYAARVPRMVPRLTPAGGGGANFSRDLYLQHREYNAVLGAAALLVALSIKMHWFQR